MAQMTSDVTTEALPALLHEHRRAGEHLVLLWPEPERRLGLLFWEAAKGRLDERIVGPGPFLRPSRHGFLGTAGFERQVDEQGQGLWAEPEETLTVRGAGLHLVPHGPVRADAGEAVRYALTVYGDEIHHVQIQSRFKRRHALQRMARAPVLQALSVAEHITGTSPVAHSLAFSLAVEACRGQAVSEDLARVRVVLAELERVMSHLGDLAVLAQATGTIVAQADLFRLKERMLRLHARLVGHRYLRGVIAPGGVRRPVTLDPDLLVSVLDQVGREFAAVRAALDRTPSFLDRLHGAGRIPADMVAELDPTGFVGKSAGLRADWRWDRPYDLYGDAAGTMPRIVLDQPDAYGRYVVRCEEIGASLALIRRLVPHLRPVLPAATGQEPLASDTGIGAVEAPRGSLVYRVSMTDAETVDTVAIATPSARNWPSVAPALEARNILQDFPIIEASFNLSVAGWDL